MEIAYVKEDLKNEEFKSLLYKAIKEIIDDHNDFIIKASKNYIEEKHYKILTQSPFNILDASLNEAIENGFDGEYKDIFSFIDNDLIKKSKSITDKVSELVAYDISINELDKQIKKLQEDEIGDDFEEKQKKVNEINNIKVGIEKIIAASLDKGESKHDQEQKIKTIKRLINDAANKSLKDKFKKINEKQLELYKEGIIEDFQEFHMTKKQIIDKTFNGDVDNILEGKEVKELVLEEDKLKQEVEEKKKEEEVVIELDEDNKDKAKVPKEAPPEVLTTEKKADIIKKKGNFKTTAIAPAGVVTSPGTPKVLTPEEKAEKARKSGNKPTDIMPVKVGGGDDDLLAKYAKFIDLLREKQATTDDEKTQTTLDIIKMTKEEFDHRILKITNNYIEIDLSNDLIRKTLKNIKGKILISAINVENIQYPEKKFDANAFIGYEEHGKTIYFKNDEKEEKKLSKIESAKEAKTITKFIIKKEKYNDDKGLYWRSLEDKVITKIDKDLQQSAKKKEEKEKALKKDEESVTKIQGIVRKKQAKRKVDVKRVEKQEEEIEQQTQLDKQEKADKIKQRGGDGGFQQPIWIQIRRELFEEKEKNKFTKKEIEEDIKSKKNSLDEKFTNFQKALKKMLEANVSKNDKLDDKIKYLEGKEDKEGYVYDKDAITKHNDIEGKLTKKKEEKTGKEEKRKGKEKEVKELIEKLNSKKGGANEVTFKDIIDKLKKEIKSKKLFGFEIGKWAQIKRKFLQTCKGIDLIRLDINLRFPHDKKLQYLNEKVLYNVQEVMEEIDFDMLHIKKDTKQLNVDWMDMKRKYLFPYSEWEGNYGLKGSIWSLSKGAGGSRTLAKIKEGEVKTKEEIIKKLSKAEKFKASLAVPGISDMVNEYDVYVVRYETQQQFYDENGSWDLFSTRAEGVKVTGTKYKYHANLITPINRVHNKYQMFFCHNSDNDYSTKYKISMKKLNEALMKATTSKERKEIVEKHQIGDLTKEEQETFNQKKSTIIHHHHYFGLINPLYIAAYRYPKVFLGLTAMSLILNATK